MPRHGLKIVRDENAIQLICQREHLGVGNPLQVRLVRREEVHRGLSAQTAGDDPFVEIGVRQEADHPSGSSRKQLLPRALQLFLEVRRCRVRLRELVLNALALCYVLFHFFLSAQVEGDRAVDLL